MSSPGWLLPVSINMFPEWAPVDSCLSRRFSKISRWLWPRLFSNNCFFPGFPRRKYLFPRYLFPRMCEILCAPYKSGDLISWSPLALLILSPTGLQSQTFLGVSCWYKCPALGTPVCSLDPLLLEEKLCSCDYPPICRSYLGIWVLTMSPSPHSHHVVPSCLYLKM